LEDADVVELFTFDIPRTASAVLLTSRRSIAGVRSIVVKGFDGPEAEEFILSRVKLYGLDATLFSKRDIAEIAKATEGSPLYIDDLLRLTKVLPVDKALKLWRDRKGDEARKYALQREMEQLTPDAKSVLVAAAIADSPISLAELESILEFSEDRIHSALDELQTLFLFPKPSFVEGEQRFEINLNTKQLVRVVEGSNDLYARVERASMVVRGQLAHVGQGVIGSLIRQAQLRLNANREGEAEQILLGGIEKHPHADLHSFLAYVYKRLGRTADARKHFELAYKLKSSRADMYLQWINMEMTEKEWSKAIAVADKGLKSIPEFHEMAERLVFAKRQAGFDFHRGLHKEKAQGMWREAVGDFKFALRAPEDLGSGERHINASLFCSAVICLDMLGEHEERDRYLRQWAAEHPDDPRVERQRDFLEQKRRRYNGSVH
jgi:tetratricopeptide (TPR) repeat protein